MRTNFRLRNGDHSFALRVLFLFAIAYFGWILYFSLTADARTYSIWKSAQRPIRHTLEGIVRKTEHKTMKYTLIFIFAIIAFTSFSQTIDLNELPGTWLCYKATQRKVDMTEYYKDHYATFKSDSTYIEERQYYFNTTKGVYHLDKKTKTLSFKKLVNTTKYPNAKVKMDDLMIDITQQNEIITSLDKDNLVILLKGTPNTELPVDTYLYYKRQK